MLIPNLAQTKGAPVPDQYFAMACLRARSRRPSRQQRHESRATRGQLTSLELRVGLRSIRNAQPLERLNCPVRRMCNWTAVSHQPVVGMEVDVVLKAQ